MLSCFATLFALAQQFLCDCAHQSSSLLSSLLERPTHILNCDRLPGRHHVADDCLQVAKRMWLLA